MKIIPDEPRTPQATSFPFGSSADAYAQALQTVRTRDLLAEIEAAREDRAVAELLSEHEAACWLVLDTESTTANAVARMQADRLAAKVHEIARRRRLIEQQRDNPYAPSWPAPEKGRRDRVSAVKAALPMELFCRDHLLIDMTRSGDRWKGRCPFPGHDDGSPSFVVFPDGKAWCFGCNRGGDLLAVAMAVLNITDFRYALSQLESLAGIGGGR